MDKPAHIFPLKSKFCSLFFQVYVTITTFQTFSNEFHDQIMNISCITGLNISIGVDQFPQLQNLKFHNFHSPENIYLKFSLHNHYNCLFLSAKFSGFFLTAAIAFIKSFSKMRFQRWKIVLFNDLWWCHQKYAGISKNIVMKKCVSYDIFTLCEVVNVSSINHSQQIWVGGRIFTPWQIVLTNVIVLNILPQSANLLSYDYANQKYRS